MLFQELFYGPYFCQVQEPEYYGYTELHPRRADDQADAGPRQADWAWSSSCRCTRRTRHAPGIYYNTAAVIDADGSYLGKYRKTHIPHVKGFWEKYYFRPGNLGYPVFETAVGKVGVYICYDRHFPEGAPRARPQRGRDGVHPVAPRSRGLSEYLWRIEQVSHALANGYFVGTINRVGIEPLGEDDFYGQSYFVRPARPVHRRRRRPHDEELHRPGHGPRPHHGGPPDVAVLPRPAARPVRRPRPRRTARVSDDRAAATGRSHARLRSRISVMIPRGSAAKEEGSRAA